MSKLSSSQLNRVQLKFRNLQSFLKAVPYLLPVGNHAVEKLANRFCVSPEFLKYLVDLTTNGRGSELEDYRSILN